MTPSSSTRLWLFSGALVTLGLFYLLQAATPLRLDNDAVDYLRMAAAIADGRPLPPVFLPPGYPIFLASLDRAGLGFSFFFVLANCLFLGAGMWAVWNILDDTPILVRQAVVVLSLLVTPVVKSVAAPLPETLFLGTSLFALLAMKSAISAAKRSRLWWLAGALVLAGLATSIRLVGVALLPALLLSSLLALHDPSGSLIPRRWLPVATIAVVAFLAALSIVVSRTAIFQAYISHPRFWYAYGQLSSPVTRRIAGTFSNLGELTLNIPRSRFHSLRPLFIATGVVAAIAAVATLRRPLRPTPVGVYLVSYVTILVFWPYDSPRLWMPIAPLLVALVASTFARFGRTPQMRRFIGAYTVWFALTGAAALTYTTRISLSGAEFARLYGRNGGMAIPNQEGPSTPETMAPYNALADSILRRYGARDGNRR